MYTYETIYLIFYINMSIDYSDFTLYGTTVQLFMYNPCTMIDYTPHSLKIVCTRLVQLSIFTKEALNLLSI